MPDITMCPSLDSKGQPNKCPEKEKCYRYWARPDGYQSYFMDPPYDELINGCEMNWERENPANG